MPPRKRTQVAVVMPCYKHGEHVKAAIASLAKQTFKKFGVVFVSDGEPDPGTLEALDNNPIISNFAVVILGSNYGPATAISLGHEAAIDIFNPEYMTWVSSDNEMTPTWLEDQVQCLEIHDGFDVVYSSYWRQRGVMRDGRWVKTADAKMHKTGPYVRGSLAQSENCFMGPAFLYRRRVWENIGHHRGIVAHDFDWWLRTEEDHKFLHFDRAHCHYRVHKERMSVVKRNELDAAHWLKEARERRADQRVEGRLISGLVEDALGDIAKRSIRPPFVVDRDRVFGPRAKGRYFPPRTDSGSSEVEAGGETPSTGEEGGESEQGSDGLHS